MTMRLMVPSSSGASSHGTGGRNPAGGGFGSTSSNRGSGASSSAVATCAAAYHGPDPRSNLVRAQADNRLRVISYIAMAKSPCPISLTQFLEKAEPVKVVING